MERGPVTRPNDRSSTRAVRPPTDTAQARRPSAPHRTRPGPVLEWVQFPPLAVDAHCSAWDPGPDPVSSSRTRPPAHHLEDEPSGIDQYGHQFRGTPSYLDTAKPTGSSPSRPALETSRKRESGTQSIRIPVSRYQSKRAPDSRAAPTFGGTIERRAPFFLGRASDRDQARLRPRRVTHLLCTTFSARPLPQPRPTIPRDGAPRTERGMAPASSLEVDGASKRGLRHVGRGHLHR